MVDFWSARVEECLVGARWKGQAMGIDCVWWETWMDSFGREGDDIMGVLKIQDESVDRGRVVDFYVHFMYIKIAIRDGINVKRGKI